MKDQNSHSLEALGLSEDAVSWLKSKRVRTIESLMSLMLTSPGNYDSIIERIGLSAAQIEMLENQAGVKLPTRDQILTDAEKNIIKREYPMGAEPETQEPNAEGGENEHNS